ncbi:nucleotidyltransferase domain-containing protein [Streptomyces beijiangensis]|nr:nucleotidyltransferase domain-containing protein [Streptomyces beijiangensis]
MDETMDEAARQLIDRFQAAATESLPLVALWVHGSLAAGDYRPGISDLDLVAVIDVPPGEADALAEVIQRLHEALDAPLLHCAYLPLGALDDPAEPQLAYAQQELMHRPVTPVARRELLRFGLVRYGPEPAGLLPPVPDEQLAAFVVADQAGFWLPSLDRPEWYLRDIWVDHGMVTAARAAVTLEDGRLITKGEALGVLADMGAPAEVVDDIRRRRYGAPPVTAGDWPARRAELTLGFLRPMIGRLATGVGPTR